MKAHTLIALALFACLASCGGSADAGHASGSEGSSGGTSRWITDPDGLTGVLVAPLKPAEFVIFRIGQKTVVEPGLRVVPRECRGTSHVLLASLVEARGRMAGPSGTGKTMATCLDAGR